MDFQKYTSLESASRQKTINAAVDAGHEKIMYAISEKIHGANFGIHWDRESDKIRFSRRSGFLEDGETFYAHTKIADVLIKKFSKLFEVFNKAFKTMSVYGEIFGGSLNGETEQGSKKVQKEVQYAPDTHFAAFDLILDGDYLRYDLTTAWLQDYCGFFMAPLLDIVDSLEAALAIPNDGQSVVPKLLGYEVEGDNISEGTVIRPWIDEIDLPNGKRFILKNKNVKFNEKGVGKVAKPQEPMSATDEGLYQELTCYITENRFNAVVSKEKELTQKDFGRILGLFMQDAIVDYDNDFVSDVTEHVRDRCSNWKRLNRELQKVAVDIVRNYWKNEL